MDNDTPSWVQRAVMQMRASDTYQQKVFDEHYETLPVPVWNSQRTWLVVGFGVNMRSVGPLGIVTSRPPHIVCAIEWPQGALHWVVDNTAQRAWPTQADLPDPVIPTPLDGDPTQRRQRYYEALSKALDKGAFAAGTPADPRAACEAARATRDALLPASPYKNLAPYYATPLHAIDGWIASTCGNP